MRRIAPAALVAAFTLAAATPALAQQQGQWPPARTTNLKVYPQDIPVRALLDSMQWFTRALGVRCSFCHVGQEGQPLSTYDFAADTKSEKEIARTMLRMVRSINGEHLSQIQYRSEPRINVTCGTCHRGVTEPRPLQQVLLATYDESGADSTEAVYRRLRERYFGRAAYDFGEGSLADVGNVLRQRGRLADAVRMHVLNTQVHAQSAFAHRQAAETQLAAGDTTAAVASLERALALNANDGQARRMLDLVRARRP